MNTQQEDDFEFEPIVQPEEIREQFLADCMKEYWLRVEAGELPWPIESETDWYEGEDNKNHTQWR